MKLSIGLIVLAAMLSLATASPMADVGRQFETGSHAFAPGAGQGARLDAPPARFMAAPSEVRNFKAPSPDVVGEATHAQQSPESVRDLDRKLIHNLLYVTHEPGTLYQSEPYVPEALHEAARIIARQGDATARSLSENLSKLAKEVDEQKTMSMAARNGVNIALAKYFESHPGVLAHYNQAVATSRIKQMQIMANEIHMLRYREVTHERQLEQMHHLVGAMFKAFPEDTQLEIRKNVQQIEDAHRAREAQIEQERLAQANYEARAHANSQYGRPQASDPASLRKETSHENIYTQSEANPVANVHSNNPSRTSNGFQPTRGSMTGENEAHTPYSQPITESQFNRVHHDGSLADRKAATLVTNPDHVSNEPSHYYDDEGDDYMDDEDWEDEDLVDRAPVHANREGAYDFDATKHVSSADHDGVKNANPKSIETNNAHRPVPILSEKNHQASPIPETVA